MKTIIDRFEGDYAVLELPDRTTATISKKLLPNAKEGNVVQITIEENDLKEEIKGLMNDLFK